MKTESVGSLGSERKLITSCALFKRAFTSSPLALSPVISMSLQPALPAAAQASVRPEYVFSESARKVRNIWSDV